MKCLKLFFQDWGLNSSFPSLDDDPQVLTILISSYHTQRIMTHRQVTKVIFSLKKFEFTTHKKL